MKHLIATPRLILRPPTLEDAQDITRAKQEVWNELQHWMSWAYDGEETHEATLNYLEITFQDLEKGAPHLIARHQQTGDLVCMTGAAPYKDEEGHFTTGYWVTKDYLGQGYATEATNAAVRYAFKALNAKAMHIEYFEGNAASRRVIEKLGFRFVETEAGGHARCLDGAPLDVHRYVLKDTSDLPAMNMQWEHEP